MDRAYLIEVARRASGLTQAELAARSGTSQATMSAYERGLKSPTLKVRLVSRMPAIGMAIGIDMPAVSVTGVRPATLTRIA